MCVCVCAKLTLCPEFPCKLAKLGTQKLYMSWCHKHGGTREYRIVFLYMPLGSFLSTMHEPFTCYFHVDARCISFLHFTATSIPLKFLCVPFSWLAVPLTYSDRHWLYWLASTVNWTRLLQVKDSHYTVVAERLLTETPFSACTMCVYSPLSFSPPSLTTKSSQWSCAL